MMKIDTKISEIYNILNNLTSGNIIFLKAENNFQLLIGVIMSAQTTDRQVNEVLPSLFSKFSTPEALGFAKMEEVEDIIRPVGFYRVKAINIIKTASIIHKKYDDNVPSDMNQLLELAGVGRKTANVIRGACFELPAIIVDTHFSRTVTRLELTTEKAPDKIEYELAAIIPKEIQYRFSMLLNKLGRDYCHARKPDCVSCPLSELCNWI